MTRYGTGRITSSWGDRSRGPPTRGRRREGWRRGGKARRERGRPVKKGRGGLAAETAEFRYSDLPEWLGTLPARTAAFLLDGITDPNNLGTVLRNARAFGLSGVVIPRDPSRPVTAAGVAP